MDPARRKRVLKLLDGRDADRAQAAELLAALGDDGLWTEALSRVRSTTVAGTATVYHADLPLLAAAPDDLPAAIALRSQHRTAYFSHDVPDEAACLTHLAEVHVTAAWGADPPKPIPGLPALRRAPLRELHLIGVDLGDGALLDAWPLARVHFRNCTWSALPVLGHVEDFVGSYVPGVTSLGAGLPAARRVEVSGADLVDLGALRAARRLEELTVERAAHLVDWSPLRDATALRTCTLAGVAGLRDLGALSAARDLVQLEVEGADLTDLAPIARAGLRRLAVRNAPSLADLRALAAARDLRCVDLRGSSGVRDVSPLADLPDLRVLALSGTGVLPEQVPAALRPYCTWADEPLLDVLADRPRRAA